MWNFFSSSPIWRCNFPLESLYEFLMNFFFRNQQHQQQQLWKQLCFYESLQEHALIIFDTFAPLFPLLLYLCLSATWTSPPVSGLSFYDFSHLIHDFVTWWKMLWLWKLYDEQYSSIVREQAYAKSVFFFFSSLFIFIFPRFMYRSKKLKNFVPKIIVENTPNW